MLDKPSHGRHPKRHERPNQARYLTCSCHDRLPLFSNDAIKDHFSDHLREAREEFGFRLVAWVVMPEHIHLLLVPRLPEYPVSQVLRELKKRFARRVIRRWRELDAPVLSRLQDGTGATRFWLPGGGYDRNVVGGHELPEKIGYIHENPVRRGLVRTPEEWKWSSAGAYSGGLSPIVPIDRAGL
ncbi:MAG: transposase [Planctomycetota bacterium]|nr:MAG: transposase [Planctomycetota bacterium]